MIMFIALSEDNKIVKNNLNNYGAIGPVTTISNLESTFVKVLMDSKLLEIIELFKLHEIFSIGPINSKV